MSHARFDLTALSRDFGYEGKDRERRRGYGEEEEYSRSEMKWKIHTLL